MQLQLQLQQHVQDSNPGTHRPCLTKHGSTAARTDTIPQQGRHPQRQALYHQEHPADISTGRPCRRSSLSRSTCPATLQNHHLTQPQGRHHTAHRPQPDSKPGTIHPLRHPQGHYHQRRIPTRRLQCRQHT